MNLNTLLPKSTTEAGWMWALERGTTGWTELELRIAVRDAAQECRYFPRPADVIARRPHRPRDPVDAEPDRPDVCSSCGVHWYYAGYHSGDGLVHARLRCDCPRAGAGWDHPEALAWRETDRDLVEAGFGNPHHRGVP